MPLIRLNFSAYLRNRAGGLRTLVSALALVLAGGAAAAQDTLVAYVPEPAVLAPRAVEIGSPDLLSKWRPLVPVVAAAAAGSPGPAAGLPSRDVVAALDARINRVRYGSDRAIWGVEDYWADPETFYARGGDCEDFAIAKYVELRRMGVPAERMRILVGYDTGLGDYHAYLTVDLADGRWVLDIPGQPMVRAEDRRGFQPIFAINEMALWQYR